MVLAFAGCSDDPGHRPSDTDPPSTTGAPSTTLATGRFDLARGSSPVVGTGRLRTYSVEVETGTGVDPPDFARAVDATLADSRGWTADETIALQRVPTRSVDFRIVLATPATTDELCAPLRTKGEQSCHNRGLVVINLYRWLEGAAPSGLPLVDYRRYVVSHEVGHALGHGHVGCPGAGMPAPVMMQQTISIGACTPNPWPNP